MKKITLLILLVTATIFSQAQTIYRQTGVDSIALGKPAGTSGISLYGRVSLKNVSSGLTTDSLLTVLNGRIRKIPATGSNSYIQNQKLVDQNASIRISESIAVGDRNIITSNLTAFGDSVYNGAAFGPDNRIYSWYNFGAGTGNFLDGKITGAVGNTNIGTANDSFVSGNRNVVGRAQFPVLSQGVDDPGLGTGNKAYVVIDVAEGDISAHFPNSQLDGNTTYINANYETGYTISGGYVSNPAVAGATWRMPPYMILRSASNEIDISLRKILKATYSGAGTKIYYDTTASVYSTISYVYGSYSPVVKVKGVFGGNGEHASGLFTSTRGYGSDASGSFTRAWNNYAKASNWYTRALGIASSSFGYETDANTYAHLVGGRWNVGGGTADSWVTGDPLFELGNGTSSGARSNAFRVLKNGNTNVYGTFGASGVVTLSSLSTGIVGSSSGVLSNITALPSGTTATTQTAGDNSTKVATTAYVATAVSGVGTSYVDLTTNQSIAGTKTFTTGIGVAPSATASAINLDRFDATSASLLYFRTGTSSNWTMGQGHVSGSATAFGIFNQSLSSQALKIDYATNELTLTGPLTGTSAGFAGNVAVAQTVDGASTFNNTNSSTGTSASARFNATNSAGSNIQMTTYGTAFSPNVFGASRANWSAVLTNGASSNGMIIGTLTSDPVVIGTNDVEGITLSSSRAVQFHSYGAGTLTTDASGNITATSDERMKDISGFYTTGLEALKTIKPITYKWKATSKLDTKEFYTGFSAQNIHSAIPEAAGKMANGDLTIQDRPIMATMVNAINELNAKIEALEARIKALEVK